MNNLNLTRRQFLKVAAVAGSAASLFPLGNEVLKGLATAAPAQPSDMKVIQSACRQCYGRCTINGFVKDGRVLKVEGKPGTFSEGTVCSRAFSIPQIMHSPLRIKYPMKRVGARGEGKWQRITWEEAWDIIIPKMKEVQEKYGGHTIVFNNGTGRDQLILMTMQKCFYEMGSTGGFGVGNVCKIANDDVQRRIVGNPCQFTGWDGPKTKTILMMGRALYSWGYYDWLTIKRAQERGAKLIVVDPRYTVAASKADLWLPVRQGSDLALILTFINMLITENRYDKTFVAQWTNAPFLVKEDGFLLRQSDLVPGGSTDQFIVWDETSNSIQHWDAKAMAWSSSDAQPALLGTHAVPSGKQYRTAFQALADSVKMWTPEKAAEVTWVPAEKIREAARLYIDNSPGACFMRGQKIEFSNHSSSKSHAIAIMMALAGNLDAEGGNLVRPDTPHSVSAVFQALPPHGKIRKETIANIKKYSLCPGQAKISGEIGGFAAATTRALITEKPFLPRVYWGQTTEPMAGSLDSRQVCEALKKFELTVNVDLFMTPTGELSDIILPAAHPNEVDRIEYPQSGHSWPAANTCSIRQPFVPPPGECRDDVDIIFDLAKRMNVDMGWKDKYHWFEFALAPSKITFEELRKKGHLTRPVTYRRYQTGKLRRDNKPGFQTSSGKVNLYSEDLKKDGWGPLPAYIEEPFSPLSNPEMLKDYPYIFFTGGRSHAYFHSEYRMSPFMREIHPFPTVEINPKTAEKHGINDGDWVYIETQHGRCKQRACLTTAIAPHSIHCDHDWWFPEKPVTDDLHGIFECNPNAIVSNDRVHDPAVGTSNYGGLCKIYKAEDGPPNGIYMTAQQLEAFMPKAPGRE
ncbi:MAG: Anaerobic dehydrogenase, typically selenocysteine-containing [Firmicutes bacterium]|nr:Anaerobic dehydrogenase, typically selenocysteine-containing [Bacillota bacterium]